MPLEPYMVAFSYGSVVFFHAGPKLRQRHLAIAREVAADPVSSDRPYVEGGRVQVGCGVGVGTSGMGGGGVVGVGGCVGSRTDGRGCRVFGRSFG